ncbi:MAG: hypothetical protein IPM64_18000 [Phycisphaerales bacterium]|nr:hypothetical protein [Phycisphaerales bacterium]
MTSAIGNLLVSLGQVAGGDSPLIVVQPYAHNAPQRVLGTELTLFLGEFGFSVDTITAYDTQSPPVAIDLTGMALRMIVANHAGTVLDTLIAGAALTVVDAAAGQWSFTVPATITGALYENEERLWWTLKDYVVDVRDETIGRGRIQVLRRDEI